MLDIVKSIFPTQNLQVLFCCYVLMFNIFLRKKVNFVTTIRRNSVLEELRVKRLAFIHQDICWREC